MAKAKAKAKAKTQTSGARTADRQSLGGQLRAVITARRLTAYAVAKAAGVDIRLVQRFLDHERDIRLETANKLARALGLRLVEVTPRQGVARGQPQATAADDGGRN